MITELETILNDVILNVAEVESFNTVINPYAFQDVDGLLKLNDYPFVSFQEPFFQATRNGIQDITGNLEVTFVVADMTPENRLEDAKELEVKALSALFYLLNEKDFTLVSEAIPNYIADFTLVQFTLKYESFCIKK